MDTAIFTNFGMVVFAITTSRFALIAPVAAQHGALRGRRSADQWLSPDSSRCSCCACCSLFPF